MKPVALGFAVVLAYFTISAQASDYGLARLVPEYNWASCNLKGHVKSIRIKQLSYYHDAGTPPPTEGKEVGGARDDYSPSGKLLSERSCDNGQMPSWGNWLISLEREAADTSLIYKHVGGGNTRRIVRANNGYSEFDSKGWIIAAETPVSYVDFGKMGMGTRAPRDKWEYQSDADGVAISKYELTHSGPILKGKFWLSTTGLLEQEVMTMPPGLKSIRQVYEYEFDPQGNWIERRSYYAEIDAKSNITNKKLQGTTLRTIEYY